MKFWKLFGLGVVNYRLAALLVTQPIALKLSYTAIHMILLLSRHITSVLHLLFESDWLREIRATDIIECNKKYPNADSSLP